MPGWSACLDGNANLFSGWFAAGLWTLGKMALQTIFRSKNPLLGLSIYPNGYLYFNKHLAIPERV